MNHTTSPSVPSAAPAARYSCSPALHAYQQAFARRLNIGHAFGFWKGRVALYAALRALGIGPGDEVIVPGYTCVMAVNPIMYLGATPVFADIDPATYNLIPAQLAALITPKTRVILAQHTYGIPLNMDDVLAVASQHGVTVIEDCCLSLGSTWKGRMTGTFGTMAYFSFQWNKPYTSGLGGMLVTDDTGLAREIERLCAAELVRPGAREVALLQAQLAVYRACIYPRTTALAQTVFRALSRGGLVVGSSSSGEFLPEQEAGFFKGMSDAQARRGLRQLGRLQNNLDHRRSMKGVYDHLLRERGLPVLHPPPHADPVLVRYPVRVMNKTRALAEAPRHFVELGSWFECPLHPIETPLAAYGYTPGLCPDSERACAEVVNMPTHPRADERTARRTVDFLATIGFTAEVAGGSA